MQKLKSLLIVGFPRGLTTHVYEVAHQSIGGLSPNDANGGEILNRRNNPECTLGYLNETENGYCQATRILGAHAFGYVLKDVVQFHIMRRYLTKQPKMFSVLFVSRRIDDSIACHLLREWNPMPRELFVEMENFYQTFPTVEYDEIICNTEALFEAFESIGYNVDRYNYLTPEFIEKRDHTIEKLREVMSSPVRR